MTHIEKARELRKLIVQASTSLDDQEASEGVELFPKLKLNGSLVYAGTRINWNGTIKRAAVDLWDTKENDPDNAPTLWEDIAYRQGYRLAPEVFTSTNAAIKGERLWFGDALYESTADGNVYTPEEWPGGWKLVEA